MKQQRRILRAGLSLAGLLIIAVPAGAARVCQGVGEIAGIYGFAASRSGLVGSPLAFTGAFSGTAAGRIGPRTRPACPPRHLMAWAEP